MTPQCPFFVIGDIHGRRDQLLKILDQIDATDDGAPSIFVGDYLDRGEESAKVLDLLKSREAADPNRTICLKGNHEHMCLTFLDDPDKYGDRWFRNGGLQTLASFGVGFGAGQKTAKARDALAKAIGDEMIQWLRDLPTYWISGNVAVIHAGADPFRPIDDQPDRNLLWGHPEFENTPRADGMWVVHGHTIVEQPTIELGRIAIDTGAYATGRLTAAYISAQGVTFSTT